MPIPPATTTLDYARPGDDASNTTSRKLLQQTRRRMNRMAGVLGFATAVMGIVACNFVLPPLSTSDWTMVTLTLGWTASGVALLALPEHRRTTRSHAMMLAIAILAIFNVLPYAAIAVMTLLLAASEQTWEPLVVTIGAMLFVVAGAFVFVLAIQCQRLIRLRTQGTVGG